MSGFDLRIPDLARAAPLTNPPLRPGNAEITAEQAAQIKPESAELETTE